MGSIWRNDVRIWCLSVSMPVMEELYLQGSYMFQYALWHGHAWHRVYAAMSPFHLSLDLTAFCSGVKQSCSRSEVPFGCRSMSCLTACISVNAKLTLLLWWCCSIWQSALSSETPVTASGRKGNAAEHFTQSKLHALSSLLDELLSGNDAAAQLARQWFRLAFAESTPSVKPVHALVRVLPVVVTYFRWAPDTGTASSCPSNMADAYASDLCMQAIICWSSSLAQLPLGWHFTRVRPIKSNPQSTMHSWSLLFSI